MSLHPKFNLITDDYDINFGNVIGEGVNGKVYSCINRTTGQNYALKIHRHANNPKVRREIDLHCRSCQGSPYIVQVVDIYENSNVIYMIQEYLEGGELFTKIIERPGKFTEREVAKIMHQICSAVKHLHDMGIAHRDLKPENLLLTTINNDYIVKLTDFGFAKEISQGLVTSCYTPYYVAPEILANEAYNKSCDIWSLGVIMYILCCGYPPFYAKGGGNISPGMKNRIRAGEYEFRGLEWDIVSDDAKNLIRSMLETDATKRVTIDNIMNSTWISQYVNVPEIALLAREILEENVNLLPEINNTMGAHLNEQRIDNAIVVRPVSNVTNNRLLNRRKKENDNKIFNLKKKNLFPQSYQII